MNSLNCPFVAIQTRRGSVGDMENIQQLADLITEYGETFCGSERPEYVAPQWIEALPGADIQDFRQWFDRGFWSPEVAGALANAGISPWEVRGDAVYDLCNGDSPTDSFLRAQGC